MREAIRLSSERMLSGEGGPFGALVVLDGQVVGRGWNRVTSTNDPSAHAEIVAIREACARLGRFSLEGGTMIATCEPCPMCLGALYWARLGSLVYAANREDAARAGFDDAFLYDQLSLPWPQRSLCSRQILREEALVPFRQWVEKRDRIPY